jgi:hypothetical protein
MILSAHWLDRLEKNSDDHKRPLPPGIWTMLKKLADIAQVKNQAFRSSRNLEKVEGTCGQS